MHLSLEQFNNSRIKKVVKYLKNALLIEEFEFEGEIIYIFDPVIKHANLSLYIVSNQKEIIKGSFGKEWMITSRNKFNCVLIEFVVFNNRINLTKLIDIITFKIAKDMLERKSKCQ